MMRTDAKGICPARIKTELIHIGGADLLQIGETGRASFQHMDDILLCEQFGPGDLFAHIAEMRVGTDAIHSRILQSERDMAIGTALLKALFDIGELFVDGVEDLTQVVVAVKIGGGVGAVSKCLQIFQHTLRALFCNLDELLVLCLSRHGIVISLLTTHCPVPEPGACGWQHTGGQWPSSAAHHCGFGKSRRGGGSARSSCPAHRRACTSDCTPPW